MELEDHQIFGIPFMQTNSRYRHGAVIYLGTISKTLSPMLRIGYLVVPEEFQQVFETAKQFADRHSPVAGQDSLASLIESGGYESHGRLT